MYIAMLVDIVYIDEHWILFKEILRNWIDMEVLDVTHLLLICHFKVECLDKQTCREFFSLIVNLT